MGKLPGLITIQKEKDHDTVTASTSQAAANPGSGSFLAGPAPRPQSTAVNPPGLGWCPEALHCGLVACF